MDPFDSKNIVLLPIAVIFKDNLILDTINLLDNKT